jgi:hypothetical protein
MKKRRAFLFLLFFVIVSKSLSQDFQINLLKTDFSNNQLIITYRIDNKSASDRFLISIEIRRQSGEPIKAKTITGELGDNIKPGNAKIIIWDMGKDSISLDEDIYVKLIAEKRIESSGKGKLLLMSTIFPGWGQTKVTGQPWWLGGVAAYGALAGGIIFYNKCGDTADLYNDPLTPPEDKADLKDQGDKEFRISRIFSITAASIWVANIIWVAVMPNQKQPVKHANLYFEPVTTPNYQGAMLSLRVNF